MSQRTLTLTLDEEQVDAALNALALIAPEAQHVVADAWIDAHPSKQLQKASELLQTDWDADGSVSVYLPRPQALALLQKLGWSVEERQTRASTRRAGFPATYNLYIAPDGSTSTFELDEALTLALVGLALGGGQS